MTIKCWRNIPVFMITFPIPPMRFLSYRPIVLVRSMILLTSLFKLPLRPLRPAWSSLTITSGKKLKKMLKEYRKWSNIFITPTQSYKNMPMTKNTLTGMTKTLSTCPVLIDSTALHQSPNIEDNNQNPVPNPTVNFNFNLRKKYCSWTRHWQCSKLQRRCWKIQRGVLRTITFQSQK